MAHGTGSAMSGQCRQVPFEPESPDERTEEQP